MKKHVLNKKKVVQKLADEKKTQKSENKSNFLKKLNIYMYKQLLTMKEKNEKPFSNGRERIKIGIMILVVLILKDEPETLEYVLMFLDSVLNLIIDKISKNSEDSKTNN